LAAVQSSTCCSRAASELTFHVEIFMTPFSPGANLRFRSGVRDEGIPSLPPAGA
jgi:hypothetical protein